MTQSLLEVLFHQQEFDPVPTLRTIVAWLRPRDVTDTDAVVARMTELQQFLHNNADVQQRLSQALQQWLDNAQYFHALTSLGVPSRRGFRRELFDRLYDRFNPAPPDDANIRDVLAQVFDHNDDAEWVAAIDDELWVTLLDSLWHYEGEAQRKARRRGVGEVLYAIEMLSIWAAAEELEAEIVRVDPKVVERDSAFVAQQRELFHFVRQFERYLDEDAEYYDDAHAQVMLEQCWDGLEKVRRRMVVKGSSFSLTHLLERLDQTLQRIALLLNTVTPGDREGRNNAAVQLFKGLVRASCKRHSLVELWRQNSQMLARSVTQNASHHGEHYVTSDRKEYWHMLASASGGGVIIALMALIKMQIVAQGFGAFTTSLLASLNYGLGFVLIHLVGCTVATKQPAMTAAHFANAVERDANHRADPAQLADLLIRVGRSQFIAILGNMGLAMSVAFLLAWGWAQWQEAALISQDDAHYLLHKLDPLGSLALAHAAIAGVWLFLSGLIAGFFDNRAARLDLAGRLRTHPLIRGWLPLSVRERLAVWFGNNYGAVISNLSFGFLLGMTGYFGYLLGLPLDIRHVAFSSAELGYASAVTLPVVEEFLRLMVFVLLIGGVNLWVSFSLALWVALRSRGVRILQPGKLLSAAGKQLRSHPLSVVFPPRPEPTEETSDNKA